MAIKYRMVKSIFILGISLLVFQTALGQEKAVYYLKSSGTIVPVKDSADFILIISPPDSTMDKNLYVIKEFYISGKPRFIGNSLTATVKSLKLQGPQITFFSNGHRMRIESFKNGIPFGDVIEYYPNGKLYNVKSYRNEKKIFLKECNDSTGRVMAENGNGKWIEFLDETFKDAYTKGEVKDGLEEGIWRGMVNDSVDFESGFKKGRLISTARIYRHPLNNDVFEKVDIAPEFPGGIAVFGMFLAKNIHYPAVARQNGTQGRVIIRFVTEKDGTLSNIQIARGIGDGCDEEALRVIKASPPWKPGYKNGKPVRVAYSVPIAFWLSN